MHSLVLCRVNHMVETSPRDRVLNRKSCSDWYCDAMSPWVSKSPVEIQRNSSMQIRGT